MGSEVTILAAKQQDVGDKRKWEPRGAETDLICKNTVCWIIQGATSKQNVFWFCTVWDWDLHTDTGEVMCFPLQMVKMTITPALQVLTWDLFSNCVCTTLIYYVGTLPERKVSTAQAALLPLKHSPHQTSQRGCGNCTSPSGFKTELFHIMAWAHWQGNFYCSWKTY